MKVDMTGRLKELRFRNSTDAAIRKAARSEDVATFRRLVSSSLSKARKRFNKGFEATPFVAAWSACLADSDVDSELSALLADVRPGRVKKKGKTAAADVQRVAAWLIETLAADAHNATPFTVLVAAELLLRYSKQLSDDEFTTIYVALANSELCVPNDEPSADQSDTAAVSQLVMRAEIPFVLSLLLAALQTTKALSGSGSRAAARALDEATDTDGTLHADVTRVADQWAAAFVRMSGWAAAFDTPWGTQKTLDRWDATIAGYAALITPDGLITQTEPHSPTTGSAAVDTPLQILRHAARLGGTAPGSAVSALLRKPAKSGKKKGRSGASKAERRHLFSDQSDWAESALLRSGTALDADVMGLFWNGEVPSLALAALGTRIFSGPWNSCVKVNGTERHTAGDWVCTCWFQDREVAFAELESGSDDGLRHVRHVMLSLDQHFAVVTDSVTSPERDAEVSCSTDLLLAPSLEAESNTITRDLLLQSDCHAVRAVPAWLDDDRVHQAPGQCEVQGRMLHLTANGRGGVTMPLVLDWHPERTACDADWNRLTVTEERAVSSQQQAAGFRVRIGNLQLLLYRSLRRGEGLRAVLGLHTSNETVYGHIQNDGDIAPLVLVESEA